MADLVLYNYFRSSTSYRVRIALHHKNLNFEYRPIHLLKAEQRSPKYLKINPLGGVPTLVHQGRAIPESLAILEYLEELFPQNPLLPTDSFLKARVRQTCEIVNSFMHPMGNLKTLQYLEKNVGYSEPQKEDWIAHWGHQGLEALEITAQEFSGTYTFGNELSLADLLIVPQLLTCQRFKMDISRYKTLVKINENCLKLEAFKKAHPFNQQDTPPELRPT